MIWATGYRPDHAWIELPGARRRRLATPPSRRDRASRGSTSSGCPGSTRADRRCSAGCGTTRRSSPATIAGTRRTRRAAERRERSVTDEQHTTIPLSTSSSRRDTTGLPDAVTPEVVELADGEAVELRIAPVRKRLGDATVRMLAYNGSIPGPTLRVREGTEIVVDVAERRRPRDDGALARAAARQPLRRDARDAGADPGRRRASRTGSRSPTPACTGTTRTSGRTTARSWASTATSSSSRPIPTTGRRRIARSLLTLDDVLIEDGEIAPFSRDRDDLAAMGRFGNVLLVGGETDARRCDARRGEVVRLYLTNTANTRVFNVALPGARHEARRRRQRSRRAASSSSSRSCSRRPSESWSTCSSSEPGRVVARAPDARADVRARLGRRRRRAGRASSRIASTSCAATRSGSRSASASRPYLDAPPDKTLALVAELDLGVPDGATSSTPARCIPRSTSDTPGSCPKCGMKLLPADLVGGGCTMHPTGTSTDDATSSTSTTSAPTTTTTTTTTARHHEHGGGVRRHRVGGRHGRRQPDHHVGQHALEASSTRPPVPPATRSTGGSASATA